MFNTKGWKLEFALNIMLPALTNPEGWTFKGGKPVGFFPTWLTVVRFDKDNFEKIKIKLIYNLNKAR